MSVGAAHFPHVSIITAETFFTNPDLNPPLDSPLCFPSPASKPDTSDSATVLEAFKFIESAAAEFSDEDEEDSEGRDKTILDLAAVRQDTYINNKQQLQAGENEPNSKVRGCKIQNNDQKDANRALRSEWKGRVGDDSFKRHRSHCLQSLDPENVCGALVFFRCSSYY